MSRRCLELQRLARSLESDRPAAAVRHRLISALQAAAAGGGKVDDHLQFDMTPDDLAARDRWLRRAREALPDMTERQRLQHLTERAQAIERDVIAGKMDIDRPASWPPMAEWIEHLARALAHGPMISRTRYYEAIVSGDGPDRTPCENQIDFNAAFRKWRKTTETK